MKIGLIGTGLMGGTMALRLLTAGHQVWAYNRTAGRLKPLALAGVTPSSQAVTVVQAVDALVLMLTDAAAIRSVLLSDEVKPALEGRTIIQMGTISSQDSCALSQEFQSLSADYLEAPVLGSIPEAKSGKLIVMVGATPEHFMQWLPVLRCFSAEPLHVGPVGSAAALKLAMNQLIGTLTAAFAQSLSLIQRHGIPVSTFMQVVRNSALYAPTYDKKLDRMISRKFADPNFPAKHLLKDMGLFVETAELAGIDTSLADQVRQLVQLAVEQGLADADYSSLYNIINPIAPPE
ncbi:MAG: NAD(P)-dependent oxidoreductase [Cyanobacteria bacterium Co-bin8]|nr:NAD(P)-dependent oxidoreductase [Cyanobacteria bacterium Co-bin8]